MVEKKIHILLIRLSSLGDIILATSAIKMLKEIYADHIEISFLTWDSFSPALQELNIQKLNYSKQEAKNNPKKFYQFIKNFHQKKPVDFIWDLQSSWWSFKIRLALFDIPAVLVDKRKWERTFLLVTRLNFFKKSNLHVGKFNHVENLWRDFYSLFSTTDHLLSKRELNFFPFQEAKNPVNRIVFLPSAAHPLKKWPTTYFAKLMQLLDEKLPSHVEFYCLSGPSENEALALATQFSSNKQRKCLASNTLSLNDSLDLIKNSHLVISNDTGLMHQAWVHGVKVIGLFGPTIEDYGFAPFGKKVKILSSDLWCRPCSVTGSGKCLRWGSHQCMVNLTPEMVAQATSELLLV